MDLPGEKLVLKLWETLTEKGIGSLLSPWQIGREGTARARVRSEEIRMLAQAAKDAEDIQSGKKQLKTDGTLLLTTSQMPDSVSANNKFQPAPLALSHAAESGRKFTIVSAARSEINASKSILFAEDQLASDGQLPPDASVDEDWLYSWRDYAGKVSSEDLQKLWGSVLAGEIKAPGKYSLRTLEFLKTTSKDEAETISRLASYVLSGRIIRTQKEYLDSKGLSFSVLLKLQELGIVSGVEGLGISSTFKSNEVSSFVYPLMSHEKVLIVEHEDSSKVLKLEVYMLTAVGLQVLGLGSFSADIEYLSRIGKDLLKQGFNVKLADWHQVSETQGWYENELQLEAEISAT